jgi:hypothetical protein
MDKEKEDKSVFNDPRCAPLLSGVKWDGEDCISEDLVSAMSTLIRRTIGEYIDPTECRGVAALVLLAYEKGLAFRPDFSGLRVSTTIEACPRNRNSLPVAVAGASQRDE